MPATYFPEGTLPTPSDNEMRSLQKINALEEGQSGAGGGGGTVTGTGTTDRLPVWTSASAQGDSYFLQDANGVILDSGKNLRGGNDTVVGTGGATVAGLSYMETLTATPGGVSASLYGQVRVRTNIAGTVATYAGYTYALVDDAAADVHNAIGFAGSVWHSAGAVRTGGLIGGLYTATMTGGTNAGSMIGMSVGCQHVTAGTITGSMVGADATATMSGAGTTINTDLIALRVTTTLASGTITGSTYGIKVTTGTGATVGGTRYGAHFTLGHAATKGLVVKAAAAQTGNLFEALSSADALLLAVTATGTLLLPNGSAAAPSLQRAASATGLYFVGDSVAVSIAGVAGMQVTVDGNLIPATKAGSLGITGVTTAGNIWTGLYLTDTARIGWNNALFLHRDADNILAQRNGTALQEFRLYGSFTDASNYHRLFIKAGVSNFEISPDRAGTGLKKTLTLRGGQTSGSGTFELADDGDDRLIWGRRAVANDWRLNASGHFEPLPTNTKDIGSTALRIRNLFIGGYQEFTEIAAPASAAANDGRLYAKDVAGATRLFFKTDVNDFDLTAAAAGSPGGSTTHVQFNDASAFGGDAGFIYNSNADESTLITSIASGTESDLAGYQLRKSGGSLASPTDVVNGSLGGIGFFGYHTGGFRQAALIYVENTGSLSSTAMPGIMHFATSPSGSVTPTNRLSLYETGEILTGIDGWFAISARSARPGDAAGDQPRLWAHQTNDLPMWTVGTVDHEIMLGNGTDAMGGGSAATLGTIGGSGPTAAGQNTWIEIHIGTSTYWVPAWA